MNEETLFHVAQRKPPAERTVWLNEVCADVAMRSRVELLLDAHDNPGSFMSQPAVALLAMAGAQALDDTGTRMASLRSAEAPGDCIGPYQLLEQIGQGGMGAVFMAEQTQPVRRKVAVKIIRKGMDSRQIMARFDAERQALELMDHPNIARALDAGTTDSGRPYFVMELVNGLPITRYCDERRLSPAGRLALFVTVCHAVHHAHQKGFIHRDIKPSNVLVAEYDGKPVPKVIDFGIAKAAGPRLATETAFTEVGSIIGTIEYMSPEQAGLNQLDVDTRSDIYSLGVLLYELLTGTTPLESRRVKSAALLELLRLVREEEAERPSTRISDCAGLASIAASRGLGPRKLTGLVRGELDWIIMRALEKDRSRRYESANGFASDIGRYLRDEPALACPPSFAYQLRKFLQRNKGATLAASLASVMVVAGIAGTSSQAARANSQTSRANAEARRAGSEAARANEQTDLATAETERANREAARAIDERSVKQAALEQQTALRERTMAALQVVMGELFNRQLPQTGSLSDADRAFCRGLVGHFVEFTNVDGDTPADRKMRAMGYFYIGNLRYLAEDKDQAAVNYERAIPLSEALVVEFPSVWHYRDMAGASHVNLAKILESAGKSSEAQIEYRLALAHFVQEVAGAPVNPMYRSRLGETHNELGASLAHAGKFAEAQVSYGNAITIFKQLVAELPDVTSYAVALGGAYCNISHVLRATGNPAAALKQYTLATDLLNSVVQNKPKEPLAGQFLLNSETGWAMALEQLDRAPEAIEIWTRVIRAYHGPGPMEFAVHRAQLLARVDPARAAAAARELMLSVPDDLEWSPQLADIFLVAGDTNEYKRLCAGTLGRYENLKCANQPGRRDYLLARLLLLAPDSVSDSAVPLDLAGTAMLAEPRNAVYLQTLALAYFRAGKYKQAIKQINDAMQLEPNWAGQPLNWFLLAMAHYQLGNADEARRWRNQATDAINKDPTATPQAYVAMGMDPHDWLTCDLLRREATAMISSPPPATLPTTRAAVENAIQTSRESARP